MRPTVVGISYRTAPVEAREQVALADEALRLAHRRLAEQAGQAVILSTCNRTEFYTLTDEPERAREAVAQLLREDAGVDYKALESYFYTHHQEDAARHLFRVACSLDSMILGESEVLRQVRESFATASEAGTVRAPLTRLFHQALRVGKRARNETDIGRNALSVSYACVELARRTVGDLRGLRALVVGTGEAGKLAAKALHRAGVGRLTVTNRSLGPAEELAALLGGEVAPLERLASAMAEVDIVVSCTGAPTYVLTQDQVAQAMRGRDGRPLFLLDIAVPRDVAPQVATVPGVRLADIDDLEVLGAVEPGEARGRGRPGGGHRGGGGRPVPRVVGRAGRPAYRRRPGARGGEPATPGDPPSAATPEPPVGRGPGRGGGHEPGPGAQAVPQALHHAQEPAQSPAQGGP